MPKVTISVPQKVLVGNVDWEIDISSQGSTVGTLKVSSGSIDWWPKGSKVNCVTLKWAQFGEALEEYGKAKRGLRNAKKKVLTAAALRAKAVRQALAK